MDTIDVQKLIDEVKIRYPVGTRVQSVQKTGRIGIITDHLNIHIGPLWITINYRHITDDNYEIVCLMSLYSFKTKEWAEIIPFTEKPFNNYLILN